MHKGQLPYQPEGGTSNGVRPRVYHFGGLSHRLQMCQRLT